VVLAKLTFGSTTASVKVQFEARATLFPQFLLEAAFSAFILCALCLHPSFSYSALSAFILHSLIPC